MPTDTEPVVGEAQSLQVSVEGGRYIMPGKGNLAHVVVLDITSIPPRLSAKALAGLLLNALDPVTRKYDGALVVTGLPVGRGMDFGDALEAYHRLQARCLAVASEEDAVARVVYCRYPEMKRDDAFPDVIPFVQVGYLSHPTSGVNMRTFVIDFWVAALADPLNPVRWMFDHIPDDMLCAPDVVVVHDVPSEYRAAVRRRLISATDPRIIAISRFGAQRRATIAYSTDDIMFVRLDLPSVHLT